MTQAPIPILGFAAASGTGKTTLLCRLLPLLKQQGLRVGLIKHSHHDFQIDQPGKDSFRLREAGADAVLLVSQYRQVIITDYKTRQEPGLFTQIEALAQSKPDLILVEGFKHEAFPKIELHRASLDSPLLFPDDPNIIAVATDKPLTNLGPVSQLDLNQPQQIADFILHHFLRIS